MRTSSETTRLRDDLLALVRKRVPASDAEDVVQSTLMEALAAKGAPSEHEPFRKFAFGVAKNKIADYYRRSKRETLDEAPDAESPPENHEGRSLLHWAEERLPNSESKKTFDWMLREGDGEKLETIAEDESVPAPRIRKRVSRLREHLRLHWKHEVALLAAMGIASLLFLLLRERKEENIVEDAPRGIPSQTAPERLAEPLRLKAHRDCEAGRFVDCLEGLDRARAIDPAGESKPGVAADRARAVEVLSTPKASPTAAVIPNGPLNRPDSQEQIDEGKMKGLPLPANRASEGPSYRPKPSPKVQSTSAPPPQKMEDSTSAPPAPKMEDSKSAPPAPKAAPKAGKPTAKSASPSSFSEVDVGNVVQKEGPPGRQFEQKPTSDVPSQMTKSAPVKPSMKK